MKVGLETGNMFMRLRRCDFRAFVHPVEDIKSVATRAGLVVRYTDNNLGWQALVFERAA
jgi:hypothetical protein